MQALSNWIKEIKNDPNISTLNEAQARRSVIERILEFLGWNTSNYNEVKLEYGVKAQARDSVDYTLQVNKKDKVFIEAKSPKEDLKKEKHQEQLFKYSAQKNPDLAILTNGILWWFYLPRAEGDWNDRKFYTIDILEQEIEDIIEKFGLLLSRQNVASGEAVQHAESILKNRQRETNVKERLPEAWNTVIKNAVSPDSLLVDLLAETAEEVCGFQPTDDEILEFIKSHHEKWLLSPESGQEVPPPVKHRGTKTLHQTKKQTGTPKRMQIGSKSYELENGYDILVNTANWLIDKGDLKPEHCPIKKVRGSDLINKTGDGLEDCRDLKNGLYIDTHGAIKKVVIPYAKKLLKNYEYDPEMLKIEYTDIPKSEDHSTSPKRTTQIRTEVAEFRHRRVLLININRQFREGASLDEVYEATRFAWKISKSRAEKAEVILATYQGEIRAAFIADEWLEATPENFQGRGTPGSERFGFIGREASPDIQELYVGKRVPDKYRKRGAANPIKYVNC